jgi:5-methylcytosine-specific restriction endonuclease McrA
MTLLGVASAHPGGRDANGCHNDVKGGTGYHCHGGTSPHATGLGGRGTEERSASQRSAFVRANPCPSTGKTNGSCPGYHVDHVVPLACGGSDHPSNMQWLPAEANLKKGSLGCRR